MEDLKQVIYNIEDKVMLLLYNALLEWQEKSGKEYFVIEQGNYFGVKYIDLPTDTYAIPLGSIYASNGYVMWNGREDYSLPNSYNYMFDYEEVENYKTLKRGDMILSDIFALYELVKGA